MKIERFEPVGLILITPELFKDERGYFCEIIRKNALQELGIEHELVQMNQSFSMRHVIRGLHFQTFPQTQGKMVRVVQGRIIDVAVDIRPASRTFMRWHSVIMDAENPQLFWIPRGFAHGFGVLSETATVEYLCDAYYAPEYDSGIIYNDPQLDIDWGISNPIVSKKDIKLKPVNVIEMNKYKDNYDTSQ